MFIDKNQYAVLGIAIAAIAIGVGAFSLSAFGSLGAVTDTEEKLGYKGELSVQVYDENGNLKDERHLDNLIVNTGFEGIADRIAGHTGFTAGEYNYVALGTGTTAPAGGDTALQTELAGGGYARQQDTDATYTSGSKSFTIQVTFGAGVGSGAVTESGLFDASTTGNMLARQTFSAINKASGDSLTITWTITES